MFESNKKREREGIKPAWPYEMHQMSDFVRPLFCVRAASFEGPISLVIRRFQDWSYILDEAKN